MNEFHIVAREYTNKYTGTKVVIYLTPKISKKFDEYERLKKNHRLYTIERDDDDDE